MKDGRATISHRIHLAVCQDDAQPPLWSEWSIAHIGSRVSAECGLMGVDLTVTALDRDP